MDKLREFIKENKGNIILLCAAVLLYAIIFAVTAHASEVPEHMEDAPETGYVLLLHTLVEAAESNQEFLEAMIEQLETFQQLQITYNHWSLALKGMTVALIIILIFAKAWGR